MSKQRDGSNSSLMWPVVVAELISQVSRCVLGQLTGHGKIYRHMRTVYGRNRCRSHDMNGTALPGGLESSGVYNLRKGKMRLAKCVIESTGSKGIIQSWSGRESNILWRARGGHLDMWYASIRRSLVSRDFWGIRGHHADLWIGIAIAIMSDDDRAVAGNEGFPNECAIDISNLPRHFLGLTAKRLACIFVFESSASPLMWENSVGSLCGFDWLRRQHSQQCFFDSHRVDVVVASIIAISFAFAFTIAHRIIVRFVLLDNAFHDTNMSKFPTVLMVLLVWAAQSGAYYHFCAVRDVWCIRAPNRSVRMASDAVRSIYALSRTSSKLRVFVFSVTLCVSVHLLNLSVRSLTPIGHLAGSSEIHSQ
ncbi:hypothetical protein J3A83DRAFT_4191127 [Scleroderma citrinum]